MVPIFVMNRAMVDTCIQVFSVGVLTMSLRSLLTCGNAGCNLYNM